jgi:hypothetical protein
VIEVCGNAVDGSPLHLRAGLGGSSFLSGLVNRLLVPEAGGYPYARCGASRSISRKEQDMRKHMLATAGVVFGITLSVSADTYFVDDSVSTSGDGSSWAEAFKTLQEGFAAAVTGDEIRVGQGTYKPGSTRTDSFVLERVDLLGGWAGFGAGNPDARDPFTYLTILSGEIGSAGYSDNVYHVVTASDSDMVPQDTLVDGFIITLGNGNGTLADGGGGGIKITDGASPRFDRCIITANRSGARPSSRNTTMASTAHMARESRALRPHRCSRDASF